MATRGGARSVKGDKPVLLRGFPVDLHRAMKAEAARQGRRVGEVYAEACEQYLTKQGRRKGA